MERAEGISSQYVFVKKIFLASTRGKAFDGVIGANAITIIWFLIGALY